MGNRGGERRKLFASVLLLVPSVVMFLENASLMEAQRAFNWLPGGLSRFFLRAEEWVVSHIKPALFSPTAYSVFAVVALVVLIISFFLALLSGWSLRGSGRNSLGNFFRLFLSRFFIGELALSLYGLFIFVLFAIILTAWLPDALEAGNPWFVGGTVFYFLSIIFATAFAYPAPKPKEDKKRAFPAPESQVPRLRPQHSHQALERCQNARVRKPQEEQHGPQHKPPLHNALLSPEGR